MLIVIYISNPKQLQGDNANILSLRNHYLYFIINFANLQHFQQKYCERRKNRVCSECYCNIQELSEIYTQY